MAKQKANLNKEVNPFCSNTPVISKSAARESARLAALELGVTVKSIQIWSNPYCTVCQTPFAGRGRAYSWYEYNQETAHVFWLCPTCQLKGGKEQDKIIHFNTINDALARSGLPALSESEFNEKFRPYSVNDVNIYNDMAQQLNQITPDTDLAILEFNNPATSPAKQAASMVNEACERLNGKVLVVANEMSSEWISEFNGLLRYKVERT